jgi:hypothetical protein
MLTLCRYTADTLKKSRERQRFHLPRQNIMQGGREEHADETAD